MTPILILRPEPGAGASATRAIALGLTPIVAPLFSIHPLAWPTSRPADALMLTSANAARSCAERKDLDRLPLYAVGEATADAARVAGLEPAYVGNGDASALLERIRADGHRRVLHLCGLERVSPDVAGLTIERVPVYRAVAAPTLPPLASEGLHQGAVTLLHSPRAAAVFSRLLDDAAFKREACSLVAISPRAADAAGQGWGMLVAAADPRDSAMLEIAARLCQNPAP